MKLLIDVIGWIGSFEVIAAYGLNSYQKIKSNSLLFQILNFTGGIFLIVNTIYYSAYPSAFINIVWVIIASVAILQMFRNSKKEMS
jgi:phosphoglycerol transferase MdoB-like AlkP superfamily enzyme